MSISNVTAHAAYQAPAVQSANNSQAKAQVTAQKAPQQPKTDTVSISQQAQTILANSKTFTPTEEASESGADKSFEKLLGQR